MKVLFNWLREFIDVENDADEVGAMLTATGLEVEATQGYESIPGALADVITGEVLTCEKHPDADRLKVTTVNTGGPSPLQIVCGAPNVAAGQKVLVATVGSVLYPTTGEALKISKSKIRGVVSEGMICAEDELGLGNSHEGIMVLPADTPAGKPAADIFPVYKDTVIEIGLTANRGDAASHLGVARDLAAVTGKEIKMPASGVTFSTDTVPDIRVKIEDTAGCIRYSGIVISGIKVGESPDWMKNRLRALGLNPINNIVDITNYVLHALGQPLHAFDADLIRDKTIVVKKVQPGTLFTTLDKVERKLNGEECMICDPNKPLAIGGVFGGLGSGITASTTSIFIESATFNPASVRKTARAHGLSTDASFRFERGTDPEMTLTALAYAAALVTSLAGGKVSGGLVDVYPSPVEWAQVDLSLQRLTRLIGQEIPRREVITILRNLQIEVEEADDILHLRIPPFRVDVKREADVAEEILRVYGLNRIGIPASMRSAIVSSDEDSAYSLRSRLSTLLANNGFLEMVNNSLTDPNYYPEAFLSEAVTIVNPLSRELSIMRRSLLFGGLESIRHNINRRQSDLKLFESGTQYSKAGASFKEEQMLAVFITGNTAAPNWRQSTKPVDFFTLKGIVEKLVYATGCRDHEAAETTHPFLAKAWEVKSTGNSIGTYGHIKPDILKMMDIDQPVWYAELSWQALQKLALTRRFSVRPVPAFPAVKRDLALVLDKEVTYEIIRKTALAAGVKILRSMNVFDVYEGDKVGEGKKSYAVSFHLQDETRTLTDTEIEAAMNKLLQGFEKELGARLRS
jgi:phenylalanyl-tRNA synthetase beta chain